jgi:hypothetical protein
MSGMAWKAGVQHGRDRWMISQAAGQQRRRAGLLAHADHQGTHAAHQQPGSKGRERRADM